MPSSTTLHNAQPRWASLDEAAEHLDVHPRTIRRAISEGRLTGYRIGKRAIRVDLNEVDALLQPIPTATRPPRRQSPEWRDNTGDTAAARADFMATRTPSERARIDAHLSAEKEGA